MEFHSLPLYKSGIYSLKLHWYSFWLDGIWDVNLVCDWLESCSFFWFDMLQSYRSIFLIKVSRWTQETFLKWEVVGCLLQDLEKSGYYESCRVSVFVDFTAVQHWHPIAWVFCSAPALNSFSRPSPAPACWGGNLHALHPEVCLGAGSHCTRTHSEKSVLTLVWRGCSCVSQSKCLTSGSTQCRIPLSLFLLLPWWISVGIVIQLHIQASHQ